ICDFLDDFNIDGLNNEETIKSVELDEEDHDTECVECDDVDFSNTQGESYAIHMHQAKKFHEMGITGRGVKVAIFDGGIARHEDLDIAGGYSAMELDGNYTDYTGH